MHHIDGDHSNDDPNNLVLIYHPDHMMLHLGARPKKDAAQNTIRFLDRRRKGPRPDTLTRGELAYAYALSAEQTGERGVWKNASREVERALNLPPFEGHAESAARAYALHYDLRWPLNLAAGNKRHALGKTPARQPYE